MRSRAPLNIAFSTVLVVTLLTLSCSRTVPLTSPGPLDIPATQAEKKKAILLAMAELGWIPVEDAKDRIRAELAVRKHRLVVDIVYENAIEIRYVDSSGLMYARTGNGAVIHQKWRNWTANLRKSISHAILTAP